MKNKIFAKLKQEYSPLGLGNEILMAKAESLAATGLVTDDNLDAVVAVQKHDLEALQKQNDKRVSEALDKERKKHEEDLKEREKTVRESILAEVEKQKDEANKKAEEEKVAKEKKAAEEAKQNEAKRKSQEEAERKKKADATLPPEIAAILKSERESMESQLKELVSKSEKRDEEYRASLDEMRKSYQSLQDLNKTLADNYEAIKKENEAAKAEQARISRENFIVNKAKELGVPQWRIDEGFALSSDADETAITETLTKVANNVKTQLLPGNKSPFPLSDDKPTKTEVEDFAKSIVK